MSAPLEAFPLTWPAGRPRLPWGRRERARFDTTFARARDNVAHEVELLAGKYSNAKLIISTNIPLRKDGLPLASYKTPTDMGVAVYFRYNGQDVSFACDRWDRIEHNMQAIAKTVEALRGIDRWGTGDMMKAAFTGFLALPAPTEKKHWREVFGTTPHDSTDAIINRYRTLRSEAHRAGDSERYEALGNSYCDFASERGLS